MQALAQALQVSELQPEPTDAAPQTQGATAKAGTAQGETEDAALSPSVSAAATAAQGPTLEPAQPPQTCQRCR